MFLQSPRLLRRVQHLGSMLCLHSLLRLAFLLLLGRLAVLTSLACLGMLWDGTTGEDVKSDGRSGVTDFEGNGLGVAFKERERHSTYLSLSSVREPLYSLVRQPIHGR